MPRVPLANQAPADPGRDLAEGPPVSVSRWYGLHIDGETPVMGALVGFRVSDDLAADSPTLRVELRLPLWTPRGLKYHELDAQLRELGPKTAQRWLKAWVKGQSA
jgi:hypothetical protein